MLIKEMLIYGFKSPSRIKNAPSPSLSIKQAKYCTINETTKNITTGYVFMKFQWRKTGDFFVFLIVGPSWVKEIKTQKRNDQTHSITPSQHK